MTNERQLSLAMDFAKMMHKASEKDYFLIDLHDTFPDMSDLEEPTEDHESSSYYTTYADRHLQLIYKTIQDHPLGQYFIKRGYSPTEIWSFITDVECGNFSEVLQTFLDENS